MLWNLLILGLVIGSNNLAVALALGAHGQASRRYRIAVVFGVFEFLVPLAGIWIGAVTARRVGDVAAVLGAALIIALGAWTVRSGIRSSPHTEQLAEKVSSRGGLIALAAGLSFDNLLVGFSLGLGDANPLLVATTIALFSVVFTLLGIQLGSVSRRHWERSAKIGSGALLLALGSASLLGWV